MERNARINSIKLQLIDPANLPNNEDFIWRYMDIHKLLDLIQHRRFYFTRMDQFEDPLEGIPLEVILRFRQALNYPHESLPKLIMNTNASPVKPDLGMYGRFERISKIQKTHFISCWFHGNRESMAMWNLYSNPDGVAIKVPFGKLKEYLIPNQIGLNIKEYFCGKVSYQDFKDDDPYTWGELHKIKKVSLRKDLSFNHEEEIRFVVKTDEKTITSPAGIKSEKLDLKNMDLSVVCHPRMADWKKNNIRHLMMSIRLVSGYSESEISLRR